MQVSALISLALWLVWTIPRTASAANVQSASSTDYSIPGGAPEPDGARRFRIPALSAAPGYAFQPAGGPWSFSPSAGLSRNGTALTGDQPAPQGDQVLVLQGASTASIAVTIPRAGFYRFRLKAALRASNPTQPAAKNIRITLGTTEVGEFKLTATDYVEKASAAIFLAEGTTTLSLIGVDTLPGDHTGFVDDLRIEMLHDWQDPAVSAQGAFQTLTFNLATQPDWNGTITGLRLDPVSGAGIQFAVDWIRGPGP
jgi:hypothetical protein